MKKNKTKYSWLLTPILACLMLTQASCSNDIAENTSDPVPGGTYLTIVTRGITTTEPGIYEDYVEELRVLAFDKAGNKVINELLTDLPNETEPNSYVEVTTTELPAGTISSGVYTFYFVANENDYNTTTSDETLTQALDAVSTEVGLKAIQVKTALTSDSQIKPSATTMLMSTEPYTALIREGEVNTIGEKNHIELIRAFAKAQLALKLPNTTSSAPSNDDVTVTLSASIPNSFYLIPENTTEITGSISLTDRAISGGGTLFDAEGVSPDPFYVSETIYLPERYLANNNIEENALTYSITIGENNYSAPIADGTEDPVNYNIIRNYAYTTIGTYNPLTKVMSEFNLLVAPWVEKEITVPPFE